MDVNPSGGRILRRKFHLGHVGLNFGGAFQDMQPHGVAGCVVQNQVQEIEGDDGAQADCKFAKQPGQVAVLQNGL